MNAFDMPTPPEGLVWRVTHRGYSDRDLPHLQPLNVYLSESGWTYGRRAFAPMAVAWNTPASVRRAALRVLRRHFRKERRELCERERRDARPQSRVMREAAKKDRAVAVEAARKTAVDERFGDLIGTYPPKRLGGGHD